jgi:hypothetical protein
VILLFLIKKFKTMKRKRVIVPELKIDPPDDNCTLVRWQKIGGGTLDLVNHKIKPNQRFWAAKESIPSGFLDTLIPISDLPKDEEVNEEKHDLGYTIKSKGGGWYDIVDKAGKKFTQRAMRLEEANKMLASL